jgi:dTDP-4-dehydrorhamnose 3,5-epimerase
VTVGAGRPPQQVRPDIRELTLPGVRLIAPVVHGDERGFFLETYHAGKYRAAGLDATFVQDNHSRSAAGILRGLHAQLARPQGKLVRCVEGEIFDVAVDIRRGSPTFGRWLGERLSVADHRQLYIPPGYAHGFCVTAGPAQVEYKCTDFYDPADEIAIAWNDPAIGIEWPIGEPQLSPRDAAAPRLAELLDRLPVYPAAAPAPAGGAPAGGAPGR